MRQKNVIEANTGLWHIDFAELWRYRDLVRMYVKRDIVTFYKQTILGPLWFVLQPLITTVMFMVVFGGIAGISTDGLPQPLFYMAGLLCWNYFADCLNKCGSTFTANQGVFGKVYFPRLVVPISITISNLVKLGVQFGLFLIIYIVYAGMGVGVHLTWYVVLVPLLVLMLAGLGLGFGLIITSVTTKYRDLTFLVQFGVQLWMYATPVIYPLSVLAQGRAAKYLWLMKLNPLTSILETFKLAFLGTGTFSWGYFSYSLCFTVVVMTLGILVFNKVQKSFMDVI